MIYQWELNLVMRERAEQHLAEIDEALQQLDMGIYGLCEKCGQPIEPERLAVLAIPPSAASAPSAGGDPTIQANLLFDARRAAGRLCIRIDE